MAIKIKNLSHSSISQFAACPRYWAARYIEGFVEAKGEAARFGDAFDKLIGERIGFPVKEYDDESGKRVKAEAGEFKAKYETPEVKQALDHYFKQKWAWHEAKETQTFVQITPDQWAELAQRYGANPALPDRIIGFVDMVRYTPESDGLDPAIRPVEVVDIKTVSQDVWKEEWARQCTLYALALNAPRFSIHRYVRNQPDKLGKRTIDLTDQPGRELIQQTMDHTVYFANRMKAVKDGVEPVEHLPRQAGWQCRYCPLFDTCRVGNPYSMPGKFSWAKSDPVANAPVNHGCTGGSVSDMLKGIG
jgi:hypothetical protein